MFYLSHSNVPANARIGGRRSPQLCPQFESPIVAQKPKIGTFVENWDVHQTGLIDASAVIDGSMHTTVRTKEVSR